MTSPCLNLPLRTHAEALAEKREDIRQEAMGNGDVATERCDELNFLADKADELRNRFINAQWCSETDAVGMAIDVLQDAIADLRGTARDIAERERNER